jgi:crotonobetainyl-CoA:carnitine CoA-transferase CaiB-like acyl-CoA transferase
MNVTPRMADSQMLAGVRVLDFTALLPGPFATVLMADLGADVIKVEPPTGDFARQMPVEMFHVANRNKRSIVVDLKSEPGRAVIMRLAKWADVAIEGFRPGVVDRLGVGPKQLREINPALIYCSLSGYGQTGPWRDSPGHDFNYLAASGAMSFLGHWSDKRPHRSGQPVADLGGGSFSVIAILAALHRRTTTGLGTTLDVSLTESMMYFMSARRGLDNDEPGRWHLYPTNDVFDTADGRRLAFGIVEPHFWTAFVKAVGTLQPRLLDPRFAEESGRRALGDELAEIIARLILSKPAQEWLTLFSTTDVPVQLVRTPREAADSAQSKERGLVQELDGERHLPFPVLADQLPAGRLRALAPELGAHTQEILSELGFSTEERQRLVADGACKPRSQSLRHPQ